MVAILEADVGLEEETVRVCMDLEEEEGLVLEVGKGAVGMVTMGLGVVKVPEFEDLEAVAVKVLEVEKGEEEVVVKAPVVVKALECEDLEEEGLSMCLEHRLTKWLME